MGTGLGLSMLARERAELYNALEHEPLAIVARLSSPLSAVLPWFAFDSILAFAVFEDLLGGDAVNHQGGNPAEMVDIPLPLAEAGDEPHRYWRASLGIYNQEAESIDKRRKRWCDEFDDVVNFKSKTKKIQYDGLFFKSQDLPVVCRHIPEMRFYCVGNREELGRLLPSITHIGANRGHGYGRVDSWSVEPSPEDWSEWFSGQPMRSIPVGSPEPSDLLRVEYAGFRPPYWAPHNQTWCVTP